MGAQEDAQSTSGGWWAPSPSVRMEEQTDKGHSYVPLSTYNRQCASAEVASYMYSWHREARPRATVCIMLICVEGENNIGVF